MTGLHLSQYRIDDELGRGGMGIVYKATDTKLNRTVALKVLPPCALATEDDRARFFREAQAAAQLHHPNIATVFQIDEAVPLSEDGKVVEGHSEKRPFIAMEFVEGETLSDYIKKGPVKLQDAVNITAQVAEALKAAHAKDIVHRDIKSANVMLTEDGIAKVLDFGLAKTNASTMLTRVGSTLGTVAYMSPEQARGQEVDGRTDLYALGTMLYEMVAGRLPFAGDYEQAILYSILNEPPEPLTAVRTGVPMDLERVVSKLLSKEADYRYQSAAGLLADLKSLDLTGSGVSRRSMAAMSAVGAAPAPKKRPWFWPAIAAVALLGGLGIGSLLLGGSEAAPGAPLKFPVVLENAIGQMRPAWSPDGNELYYLAQTSPDEPAYVARYDLRTGEFSAVVGSEGAGDIEVSPDGRWIAIHDVARNRYRRALRSGGEFSDIPGASTNFDGASFGADGRFYFTRGAIIASVGEDGEVVTHTRRDTSTLTYHVWPIPVSSGGSVFFSDWATQVVSGGTLRLADTERGFDRVSDGYTYIDVLENGYALMLPSGPSDQPLSVAPIDLQTGEPLGDVVPYVRASIWTVAVSANGRLVYTEVNRGVQSRAEEPLYRIVPGDQPVEVVRPPVVSDDFDAARARNAIAIEANPGNPDGEDIYVINLESGVTTRLTRGGNNEFPEWSHDDSHIYFRQAVDGVNSIVRRRADASAPRELVLSDSTGLGVSQPVLTSDGTTLVFNWHQSGSWDLYRIPLSDSVPLDLGAAQVISDAPGTQSRPDFSPDDRYVVFGSGGAIVVSPLDGGAEVEVTSDGAEPVWSPDGRWIYYHRNTDSEIWRVAVTTDPVFAFQGEEELVFSTDSHLHLGVHADGTLLATVGEEAEVEEGARTWIVLNFFDEIERLAPRR